MRVTLLMAFLLTGCGQAGDLYLPSDPAAKPPQPETTVPENDKKEHK
jgi:predicted small lipoprotein YifL